MCKISNKIIEEGGILQEFNKRGGELGFVRGGENPLKKKRDPSFIR